MQEIRNLILKHFFFIIFTLFCKFEKTFHYNFFMNFDLVNL